MSDDDFLFQGLDDPSPPTPSGEMLEHAVSRGRTIRRRRHAVTLVAAAGVLAAVGGVAVALNAQSGISGLHDNLVPANSGSPTPGQSAGATKHHPQLAGEPTINAGGYPGAGGHHPGKPVTSPCLVESPSPAPSASPADSASPSPTDSPAAAASPTTDATVAPTPTATSSPTPCTSPSASAAPSETPSAQPSDTPTASPSAA